MPRPTELSEDFEKTLLQLAGEVGLLVIDQETGRLTDNPSALAGRLIAIMRTLLQAANEAGVTLEAAAVKNLAKIFDRWPQERIYPKPFDSGAEPEERLPRVYSSTSSSAPCAARLMCSSAATGSTSAIG